MLRLTCFEPAGGVLELSPDDLTRHIIGFGATGGGKTTALINPLLRQIIGWKADDPRLVPGLLILDPKLDDSAAKVRAYAKEAGREDDVVVLSTDGNAWYNLLGGFERLEQVEGYARRLLSGTRDMGRENVYWTEARNGLVETALVILLANGAPVQFGEAITFMQSWWFSSEPGIVETKLEFVKQILSHGHLSPFSRRRLELALSEAKDWASLDGKTKELHRSALNNALRPLLSAAAQGLLAPKPVLFKPQAVLDGKILVVALDAISHPDLARLIFRVVRRDFYMAVQSRPVARPDEDRLCGLVADELPLSVMPEDVEALSVIRAKNGFVLAAAQSLSGLDDILGWRGREALLANFNNVFFFTSRENALDEYAMITLGTKEARKRQRLDQEQGDLRVMQHFESHILQPVCPPGSLVRLNQHQAFARLADGTRTEMPVWLEPLFFTAPKTAVAAARNDLAEAMAALRASGPDQPTQAPAARPFLIHMHLRSHRLFLTPNVVAAAWAMCVPSISRNQLIESGKILAIKGLETLPSCWLLGFIGLVKRHKLAGIVEEVSLRSGFLWPTLIPPSNWWGDGATVVPETINLSIYPSLWRPLRGEHWARLVLERPDLVDELRSLPQVAASDRGF